MALLEEKISAKLILLKYCTSSNYYGKKLAVLDCREFS